MATRLGLRGVWSWGFYTGWYPGYLIWMVNNHNGVGRFYETFGNSNAGTFTRDLKRSRFANHRINSRQWYRAWPPEKTIEWSLRNNTNYMQTGVLASLQLAARNRDTLLMNYWQKSFNSLQRGRNEKPDENGEQYMTGGECKGVTVSIGQSSGICDEGGAISDNFVSVFEAIARVAAVLLPTGVAALEDGGE